MKRLFLATLILLLPIHAMADTAEVGNGETVSLDFSGAESVIGDQSGDILSYFPYQEDCLGDIAVDPAGTCTHASVAWAPDDDGVYQSFAVDVMPKNSNGIWIFPDATNLVESINSIGADQLGTEISSGNLTRGLRYQITARDDQDFTADGAADNNVGTEFTATGVSVTLDAGDKVKEIGGTNLDDSSFETGYGEGAQQYKTGGSWYTDAIPHWTCSGGTNDESTVTVVDATSALTGTAWEQIIPGMKAIEIISGASALMWCDITGASGTDDVLVSAVAWGAAASGHAVRLRLTGQTTDLINLTDVPIRYSNTVTPSNAFNKMRIEVPAGDTVYVALEQMVSGAIFPNLPIVTQGDAGGVALAGNAGLVQIPLTNYSATEGMLYVEFTPDFSASDFPSDATNRYIAIVSTSNSSLSMLYYHDNSLFLSKMKTYDGTTASESTLSITTGTTENIIVWWSTALGQKGLCLNGTCGSTSAYDGEFTEGTVIKVGYSVPGPIQIGQTTYYDKIYSTDRMELMTQ